MSWSGLCIRIDVHEDPVVFVAFDYFPLVIEVMFKKYTHAGSHRLKLVPSLVQDLVLVECDRRSWGEGGRIFACW